MAACGGLALLGAAPVAARTAADACSAIGVSTAVAMKAYGTHVKLESLPIAGNAPPTLAEIPACFVSARGDVVATVRGYPAASWSKLIAIYTQMSPRPKRVLLAAIGAGAALYDVVAGPGRYEEDIIFRRAGAVVTVRSSVMPFAVPPTGPLRPLAALALGIEHGVGR